MTTRPTRAAYQQAFVVEAARRYPVVDGVESAFCFAIDRAKMEAAAAVLACPVKANPPNWQHGRVVYAVARFYLHGLASRTGGDAGSVPPVTMLDIGTAKGFSALCAQWALSDSGVSGVVKSVDVIDPAEAVQRNTIAETSGLRTLAQTLEPWAEDTNKIRFFKNTGVEWLMAHQARVNFAFVDGKHTEQHVSTELGMLATRQLRGDVVVCDDLQIPGVRQAVWDCTRSLPDSPYTCQVVALDQSGPMPKNWLKDLSTTRGYAVLTRR